jgi:sRNA-binding carbon storage regulator CsrA
MLSVTIKKDVTLTIGSDITITLVKCGMAKVTLRIDAPKDLRIERSDYERGKGNESTDWGKELKR